MLKSEEEEEEKGRGVPKGDEEEENLIKCREEK